MLAINSYGARRGEVMAKFQGFDPGKQIRGLPQAARQIACEEKKSTDHILNWMHRNLPPKQWNLETYISLAFFGDRTIDDLDAEELAELPKQGLKDLG